MQRLNTLNKTYESGEVLYNDNLNLIIDYINLSINAINELMTNNDVSAGHYEIRYKDSLSEPSPPSTGSSGLSDGWKRSIDSAVYNIWMTLCFVTIGNTYGTWTKAIKISAKDGSNGSFTLEVYRNDSAEAVDSVYIPEVIDDSYSSPAFPPLGWTTAVLTRTEGEYTWCILRTISFNENNDPIYGKWSTPFRLTGDNGKDGEDGKYLEYIYKHFTSKQTWQQIDSNPANWSISDTSLDILPGQENRINPQREDYIGPSELGWTDNPQGVTDIYKYEYVCQRIYNGKSYEAFTPPVIWSKYGDKGRDGDGFEYIFKGYASEQTSWDSNSDWYPPKWINSVNNAVFLGDDFRGPTGYLWEDDAIGVDDTNNKFVYVCSRKKYVDLGAERATWHTFSAPKLWALYVLPGGAGPAGRNGSYTLFIYKTTSANLNDSSNYTELTTANSGANTSEANVPSGWYVSSTDPSSASELIWGTHRLIEYNSSNEPIYRHWKIPPYMISGKNGNNGISLSSYILMLETWSDVVSVSGIYNEPTPNSGWSDGTPTNSNNYKYLWRRSRKMVLNSAGTDYEAETSNGSLTNEGKWNYVKLSGTDGTSIKVKGTVATADDLNNISNPSDGDAYKCEADGCVYVWSAERNNWVNLGQFKGDSGTTYYTHIAWARSVTLGSTPSGHTTTGLTTSPNASSVTDFSISPFDGAAWMGTLVDTVRTLVDTTITDSTDPLAYTWAYIQGPPGATTATSVYQLVATVSEIRYKRNHTGVVVWMPSTFDLKLFKYEGNSFTQISSLPSGYSIKRTIDGDKTNTATVNNNSLGAVSTSDLASYNNGSPVIGNTVLIKVLDENNATIAILELPIVREYLRMLIPMGAYVSKKYEMTDTTVPLVLGSNGKYYYLDADTNEVSNTYVDPTTDNQTVWGEATEYEVILTKALFADFAKLGSFIVYKNWFISMLGILYDTSDGAHSIDENNSWSGYELDSGTSGPAYTKFDINYPNSSHNGAINFVPNIAINAKTGKTYFNDSYINGNVNASSGSFNGTILASGGSITGDVTIGSTGGNTIMLSPNTNNWGASIIGKVSGDQYINLGYKLENGLYEPKLTLGYMNSSGTPQNYKYVVLGGNEISIGFENSYNYYKISLKRISKTISEGTLLGYGTEYSTNTAYHFTVGISDTGVAMIHSDSWPTNANDIPYGMVWCDRSDGNVLKVKYP